MTISNNNDILYEENHDDELSSSAIEAATRTSYCSCCCIVPLQQDNNEQQDNDEQQDNNEQQDNHMNNMSTNNNNNDNNTIEETKQKKSFLLYMCRQRNTNRMIKWLQLAKQKSNITTIQIEECDITPTVALAIVELLYCRRLWDQVIFRACTNSSGSISTGKAKTTTTTTTTTKRNNTNNPTTTTGSTGSFSDGIRSTCNTTTTTNSSDIQVGTKNNDSTIDPFELLSYALAEQVKDVQIRSEINFTISLKWKLFSIPITNLILGSSIYSTTATTSSSTSNLVSLRLLQQFDYQQALTLGLGIKYSKTLQILDLSFSHFSKQDASFRIFVRTAFKKPNTYKTSSSLPSNLSSSSFSSSLPSSINVLNLQWCLLDNSQIIELCYAIKGHQSIETINLSTNRFGTSTKCMNAIALLILNSNNVLKELDLSDQRYLPDINTTTIDQEEEQQHYLDNTTINTTTTTTTCRMNIEALTTALESSMISTSSSLESCRRLPILLDTLHLHSNNLTDNDATLLANAFLASTNSTYNDTLGHYNNTDHSNNDKSSIVNVRVLNLFRNNITDIGAKQIAKALRYNDTCQSLCLLMNPIGLIGFHAFYTVLKESNHTLECLWLNASSSSSIDEMNSIETTNIDRKNIYMNISYYKDCIQYYTNLNKGGRRLLRQQHNNIVINNNTNGNSNNEQLSTSIKSTISPSLSLSVPLGLWPFVLERINLMDLGMIPIDDDVTSNDNNDDEEEEQQDDDVNDDDNNNETNYTFVSNNNEDNRVSILYYLIRQGPMLFHH